MTGRAITFNSTGQPVSFPIDDPPDFFAVTASDGYKLAINPPGPMRRWLLARLGITWHASE